MQINQPAPDFKLPDLQSDFHNLKEYRSRIVIVNFWSAECPHSERADRFMMACLEQWMENVQLLSIAANKNEPTQMVMDVSRARQLPIVLIDAEHAVADLYEAITTPHVFVVDRDGILRYRGAIDDITFRRRKATRFYLQEAVESLLAGQVPELQETPAYGCTIVREI
jgi:peroxiredoxin